MSIIESRQLTKIYDKLTAVDNLDLNIEEGEIFNCYYNCRDICI